jgi:hypothetical protein
MVLIKERHIEEEYRKRIEAKGWLYLKLNIIGKRGYMDRMVIADNGRVWFVEFKNDKPLEPLQAKRKQELEALGHRVELIKNLGDVCFARL